MSVVASLGTKEMQKIKLGLQLKTGQVFAKTIDLNDINKTIDISFSDLETTSQISLPNVYPTFQAKRFKPSDQRDFDVKCVEAI